MDLAQCQRTFVGIDVSKQRWDVSVRPTGEAAGLPADGKGLEQLREILRRMDGAWSLSRRAADTSNGWWRN